MHARRIGFTLSLALGVIVTFALLAPVPDTPANEFPGLDKAVHFTMFFLTALPALTVAPRAWGWVAILVVVYGGMIEIVQPIFGRGRELADFIANSFGVLCAIPAGRFLARRMSPARKGGDHKRPQTDRRVRNS